MSRHALPFTAGVLALSLLAPSTANAQAAILNALQQINGKIEAQVVPFKVTIPGGLCDSAGVGTSTPRIEIDSDGAAGEFVVTSILLGTTPPGVAVTGFRTLSINYVEIDSDRFYTLTGNVLGRAGADGVYEAADILGMPVRRNEDPAAPVADGGNVPHQIVAESADPEDIHVEFFCSTDDADLSFATILVAGWKRPADTVTVTYVPGN